MVQTEPVQSEEARRRWWIIAAGVFGLFASLGIGRFSLGMLLPSTGKALSLSYAEMGTLSTVNFCGYLAAVLACGYIHARIGARVLITSALVLVGLSMLLIGISSSPLLIMGLYCLTGVGSALSNVPIMALAAVWFPATQRGKVAGMMVTGNGLGILLTGYLIPRINAVAEAGWRMNWCVLGALALMVAVFCLLAVRDAPAKDTGRPRPEQPRRTAAGLLAGINPIFLHSALIYFLFGFTYVIYVTFFVTSMVEQYGLSEYNAGTFWSCIGLLSLVSGPLFGAVSDRHGRKRGLMLVFTVQAAAYLLVAVDLPVQFLYASTFCFGITAWSVPSIIAALVSDHAGASRTAAVFGFVTFVFGIGQILGPMCAGLLAETTGTFRAGFLLAGTLALVAALLSALLPDPRRHPQRQA